MTQQEFNNEVMRTLGSMESSLKDIRKALFGNGQPGMTTRLTQLEGKVGNHIEDHQETGKQRFNWKTAIAASAVGALISGCFVIAIELIKHKP